MDLSHLTTLERRLGEVDSTMEAARGLAAGQDFLLVTAETQTRGKGTKGRAWQSPWGNVYMTVGINRRHLPIDRLALLPLELGLLLWEECASRLPARGADKKPLSLKWPNDLLLGEAKAAGMLVESHGDMVLAGIGINVAIAPNVDDGGASSTCLADAGMDPGHAGILATGLYTRIIAAYADQGGNTGSDPAFANRGFDPERILVEWQGKVDWNRTHLLRDREGRPPVQPVSVNRHGHLLVRFPDGRHEWLVSEYLI